MCLKGMCHQAKGGFATAASKPMLGEVLVAHLFFSARYF
jgi:hypothetical protein